MKIILCACYRFGPGLVIYWCGFLSHLVWSTEHGILVRDSFPTPDEIVYLDPLRSGSVLDTPFESDPDDDPSDEDSSPDDLEGEASTSLTNKTSALNINGKDIKTGFFVTLNSGRHLQSDL